MRIFDVPVGQPFPTAFAGFRTALAALDEYGFPVRKSLLGEYPAEAAVLMPAWCGPDHAATITALALTPSERRLHPESEQTFRTLHAAADCVAGALADGGVGLRLVGAGALDVPSVRGLLRLVELVRWRGLGDRVQLTGFARRSALSAYLAERGYPSPEPDQLLARLGGARDEPRAAAPDAAGSPVDTVEQRHFAMMTDEQTASLDRVALAVEVARHGFFQSDLEVMAYAALTGLRLCRPGQAVDGAAITGALRGLGIASSWLDAVEFEVGVLRTAVDVRAFFHKVLGIVRSFRRQNEQALDAFAAVADDEAVSPELRAQAMLYRALTTVKMMRNPVAGRDEAERGLALLDGAGDGDTVERERGWLHNVRALCAFSEGRYGGATRDEKAALNRVAGRSDASSLHLKINLVSNISVLQERAGRPEAALRTWERFANVGNAWDTIFRKHHSYRLAGLALATGDRDRAADRFADSLSACQELDDVFHRAAIGMELGGLALDRPVGGPVDAVAVEHFAGAAEAAQRLGDPYQYALAQVGLALAADRTPGREALTGLCDALTYPRQAARLRDAVEAGDRSALSALIPRPRTKLNRPFDHINLHL
ncbi:hypothetical protein [Actinoplanes siamensis]|uniref:hypothetical protein n=1 Tax=Actinoplanes siamensis TaxID=1223317 RepID=UPI00361B9F2D